MWDRHIYYAVKPFIPRRLQLAVRSMVVRHRLQKCRHIWPIDETAGREPDGWSGWPGGKQFAVVLMHDVETAKGQDRCRAIMALEQRWGFRSSFNFVPEGYAVSPALRRELDETGFEVAVHGLKHDGKLFLSRKRFRRHAVSINRYVKEWNAVGFISPSMHHNLEWTHDLQIEYDASTFDTDPFEPQPDGVSTIFPFMVRGQDGQRGYIELPYTLPQDFTLFVLMKEKNIDVWKRKLAWVAQRGGMALVITHPDYMANGNGRRTRGQYPMEFYEALLGHVHTEYAGRYWHVLPKDMARFWKERRDGREAGKDARKSGSPSSDARRQSVPGSGNPLMSTGLAVPTSGTH